MGQLQAQHGDLIFIHSVGCCDGTSPICMTKGDFYLGSRDEQIGEVVYMHNSNFSYWQHLQIIIDVSDGLGNSFSLESTENKSFIICVKALQD
ncbi:DUF779 domain-containing protein [Ureibacillus sp. MALMAid1270]|uniref:DUF779 domain-containing protein n=1 Tax=Ureibacillus sp. MALMAid1270 TaxID=3411629 RepID=UPI003BA741F5